MTRDPSLPLGVALRVALAIVSTSGCSHDWSRGDVDDVDADQGSSAARDADLVDETGPDDRDGSDQPARDAANGGGDARSGSADAGLDAASNEIGLDAKSALDDSPASTDARDADAELDSDGGLMQLPDANLPCVEYTADDKAGIYVSPAGSDTADCGSRLRPCASVGRGQTRALSVGRSLVYLDTGTYAEATLLLPGVTLQGGWNNVGGDWTRQCKAGRAASAVLASPSNVGVLAEYVGSATLDTLSVRTKPAALAGESTYGLFVRGATTQLTLLDVYVVAGAGGDGAAGSMGATPAATSGTCTAGNGATGNAASAVGTGGPSGTFQSSGFVPGDGAVGSAGTAGGNGVAAVGACVQCATACNFSGSGVCQATQTQAVCPIYGAAGCGGLPGEGGGAGHGGGASVAAFLWDATLTVRGGRLEAGSGGRGGVGGAGGAGGAPSAGTASSQGPACTACETRSFSGSPLLCAGFRADPGPTAGPAGDGGVGGSGAQGGSGAAGVSYAVWRSASAVLELSPATQLVHAPSTAAVGNGAAGLVGTVASP